MATGAVPASFTGLKTRDRHGLGFAKSSDFVRVSNLQRVKFGRTKVSVIRNSSNPGSETVELEPASEGSQLLGISYMLLIFWAAGSEIFTYVYILLFYKIRYKDKTYKSLFLQNKRQKDEK